MRQQLRMWLQNLVTSAHVIGDALIRSTMCIKPLKYKGGRRTLTDFNAVGRNLPSLRIPRKIKHLHESASTFFVVGKICPTPCRTN